MKDANWRVGSNLSLPPQNEREKMENELSVRPEGPLSANDVRAQVNRIQEVMKSVMQDGQHYGKIPGAGEKPTLLKAGAEKLIMTFRLAPEVLVAPIPLPDAIGYQVTINLKTWDGRFVGSGIGECCSLEEKYKWRAAVCTEEFDETPVDQRREKWKKGYGNDPSTRTRQVRTNPYDQANTILKMAKKRALVDATLTVLAASDIFTQDIEDMDFSSSSQNTHKKYETPKEKSETKSNGSLISDPQRKRLFALSKKAGLTKDAMDAIVAGFGFSHSDEITKDKYEEICEAVQMGKPISTPPSSGTITPEEVREVKQKWNRIAESLSQDLRVEGKKYLTERFGFTSFEEIKTAQFLEVLAAMDDIRPFPSSE